MDRQVSRRQLNTLVWIFGAVGDACKKCAAQVHRDHVTWSLEAKILDETRKFLTDIPFADIPDGSLFLRVIELSRRLQEASTVADALAQPRSEEILNHVASMLNRIHEEAMTGMAEAIRLLEKCSTRGEIEIDWQMMDAREENRKTTLQVLAELGKN